MKVQIKVLLAALILVSCLPNDSGESDVKETISINIDEKRQLKLFNYDVFILLAGVDCNFFKDVKKNKNLYTNLMKKLARKNWKFDHISMEFESCWNDSMFVKFQELNKDVFGTKLKSVYMEDDLIVIELFGSEK